MRAARLVVLAAAFALAACGGDDDQGGRAETPATATPTATPTEAPATPTATTTPTASPEEQEGGAGDEAAARVPVNFTIDGEGITPPEVRVPAFLALELIVHNDSQSEQIVAVEGAKEPDPLTITSSDTARKRLTGLRAGTYRVDAGQGGTARLVVGGEPGP
jgi:hypothetical protein